MPGPDSTLAEARDVRAGSRVRARAASLVCVAAVSAIAALVAAAPNAGGASSSVTVTFQVQSSTSMTPACATSGTATTFGAYPAGTPAVTGADCSVTFGSSNDTAALRLYQRDLAGDAMFSQPFGGLVASGFGTAGSATWDVPGGGNLDEVDDVVPLGDGTGRFYVAGSESTTVGYVARFDPDGTLDETYSAGDGSNGYFTYTDGTGPFNFTRIALQADGRLVLATWVNNAESTTLVRRYHADGTIDTSFDDDGSIEHETCDPNASNNPSWAHRMTVDSQGRILLLATCSYDPTVDAGWTIARLLDDGSLDPDFAAGGLWQWNPTTAWDVAGDLALDPQGRIVATGGTYAGGQFSTTWVRLLDDGTLDATFDGDAANRLAGNGSVAYREGGYGRPDPVRMTLDETGRILVTLQADNWSDATMDSAVMRLLDHGSRDPGFGSTGFQALPFAVGTKDQSIAITTRPGAILIGGAIGANGSRDDYAAMLHEDGTLDTSFDDDGVRDVRVVGRRRQPGPAADRAARWPDPAERHVEHLRLRLHDRHASVGRHTGQRLRLRCGR